MAQRKPGKMSDDELFSDWVDWIKEVSNELVDLAWKRRVFRLISEVFEHNPHLQTEGGWVYDWLRVNYVAAAAMTFRRVVDRAGHKGFVHLLCEIRKRPSILSRARYYQCWGELSHEFQA